MIKKIQQVIMKNWFSSDIPLLSICCATYNHEFFIEQCLDGFLMQETNFPFEIIIHDDASNDKTVNIIQKYVRKYPAIIKPIYESENQLSKGVNIYADIVFPHIRGKYVTFCEGDDYWITPFKIQTQIDFLGKYKEYSMCFHPVYMKYEDKSLPDIKFPPSRYRKNDLNLTDLLNYHFISRCSVIYRWRFNDKKEIESITKVYKNINIGGDYLLNLLHAEKGKIGFIDNVMAIYRKHKNGLWYNTNTSKFYLERSIKLINFYQVMEKRYNIDKSNIKNYTTSRFIYTALELKNFDRLKEFQNLYPKLYEFFIKTISDINFYKLEQLKYYSTILPKGSKKKKFIGMIINLTIKFLKLSKLVNKSNY